MVDSSTSAPQHQDRENTRILSILASDYLKEKKSKRRWGILFKLLVLGYIGVALFSHFDIFGPMDAGRHTALVEVNGEIGPNGESADMVNYGLQSAFESESSIGVIININSLGGSPVHSAQINEEIYRLKSLYPNKPVYVTVSDICASGGYYIAVAADQIYAHPASIIGSIGVLMDGFGFVESMKKLGIERRLLTAGENKGSLDPFSPVNDEQSAHALQLLDEVHQQFIEAVKVGRGNRVTDAPEIYSGLFWSGEKAKELGLIDDFGTVEQVARDVIGAEAILDYTIKPSVFDKFAEEMGVSIGRGLFGDGLNLR
ncbi:MAG: S49 family peptidase [Gammaproteobacteria bacterium]|nr:S49 family peptidase [Gammaproteobacteria bacterium]